MNPDQIAPADGDAPAIELEFVYTRDEYIRATVAATQAFFRNRRFYRWLGPALVVIGLIAAFGSPGGIATGWRPAAFPAGFGLFFMGLPWLAAQATARGGFHRLPAANATIRWRIGPERLSAEAPTGTTTFAWGALLRVEETKYGLLLFVSPQTVQWLPYAAFGSSEDLIRVRGWIARHKASFGRGLTSVATTPPPLPLTPQSDVIVHAAYIATPEIAESGRRAILTSANRWLRTIRWALPIVVAVAVLSPQLLKGDWLPLAIFLPVLVLMVFVSTILARAARARIFAQSPDANSEIQLLFDAEGFDVRGRSGKVRNAWTAVARAHETQGGLVLRAQPNLARYISKSAFRSPAEFDQVRAWIRAKNIPLTSNRVDA